MLSHIEEILPSTLHLPVSSEETLHFYHYLHTHVLIANKQFLLLIKVPIQDQSQQLTIYKSFTLDIPHGNFTAHYDVNTKYLGITQDETMKVEILPQQFRICQEANRQFCILHHFNHLQTHHVALLPYMSKIQPASQPDVLYKSGNLQKLVCPHNLPPVFGYWQQHPQQQQPKLHSYTGGSCLSRTSVKPDSRLSQIFYPKFCFLFPV